MTQTILETPAQCVAAAPLIVSQDCDNTVILCALDRHADGYLMSAVAQIECADELPPASVYDDVRDFLIDTRPDDFVVCWFTSAHTPESYQANDSTRACAHELIDFLTNLQKEDPSWELHAFYTDRLIWTGLEINSAGELVFTEPAMYVELLQSVELAGCPECRQEQERRLQSAIDSAPLSAAIWPRVDLNRRQVSIENEERYCGDVSSVNGRRLWQNTLQKILHGSQLLTPNNALRLLGGGKRIGKLNSSLHDAQLRDRVLLWAITGDSLLDKIEWEECYVRMREAPINQDLVYRVRRVIAVLNCCASYSADDSACAYATLAYLYWWIGETKIAEQAAELAYESNDTYRLAVLMQAIIAGRIMPPWSQTFSREEC